LDILYFETMYFFFHPAVGNDGFLIQLPFRYSDSVILLLCCTLQLIQFLPRRKCLMHGLV